MAAAIFRDITQGREVTLYQRFGAIYSSTLKGKEVFLNFLALEDVTDMLSRNVATVLPLRTE
jgi:hypothetical protein